ncbi:MAG: hypothetical protein KGI70_01345 [Patescibacteria group bacterium]|nr:hypothetical protein [Patescibacteria group bacterium]
MKGLFIITSGVVLDVMKGFFFLVLSAGIMGSTFAIGWIPIVGTLVAGALAVTGGGLSEVINVALDLGGGAFLGGLWFYSGSFYPWAVGGAILGGVLPFLPTWTGAAVYTWWQDRKTQRALEEAGDAEMQYA